MALGKLWGTIGLFHPYLAYRNINWDSALVVALPLAERATNRERVRRGRETDACPRWATRPPA